MLYKSTIRTNEADRIDLTPKDMSTERVKEITRMRSNI